jgi:hypothetical protein
MKYLLMFILMIFISGCSGANIYDSYETTPASMTSNHIGPGETISIDQLIVPNPVSFTKSQEGWQKTTTSKPVSKDTIIVIVEQRKDVVIQRFYKLDENNCFQEITHVPDGSIDVRFMPLPKKEK